MLEHILYGTVSYSHGGLLLIAKAAGERAEEAFYQFSIGGASPVVAVETQGEGAGTVTASAPSTTKEKELVEALTTSAAFRRLFTIAQASGDGEAGVAGAATRHGPEGGLLQHLAARLDIEEWANREQVTTRGPEGLLWPAAGEYVRKTPDDLGMDQFSGTVLMALALQDKKGFHHQNALLGLFRRRLAQALKRFDHPDLIGIGLEKWANTNALKDEAAGTELDQGRLRVVFSLPIEWVEPAFDSDDIMEAKFAQANIGLWREDISDALGPGGTEVLDTIIVVTPE